MDDEKLRKMLSYSKRSQLTKSWLKTTENKHKDNFIEGLNLCIR